MGIDDQFEIPAFLAWRKAGNARVTVISDGELLWAPNFPIKNEELRQAMPGADAKGRIWMGINIVVVEIGAARIIVDPALDDPGMSFDGQFVRDSNMVLRRSLGMAAALAKIGWTPESVTHVVVTHAHQDHYGGLMQENAGVLSVRFRNARHFLGQADWEGNERRLDPDSELSKRIGAIDRLGLLELIDEQTEIAPGVSVIPTPGETPGHLIVRIETGAETFFILGDLFHHRCEVEHPDWAPPHADAKQLESTRLQIYRALRQPSMLAIAQHEAFPGWGQIVHVDGSFQWRSL